MVSAAHVLSALAARTRRAGTSIVAWRELTEAWNLADKTETGWPASYVPFNMFWVEWSTAGTLPTRPRNGFPMRKERHHGQCA